MCNAGQRKDKFEFRNVDIIDNVQLNLLKPLEN